MKVSISEAARRAGVNRKTIQRKLEDGILSKEIGNEGQPLIDLSELCRVYPNAIDDGTGERTDMGQEGTGESAGDFSLLAIENARLRERCASLERERDELAADKRDLRVERDRLLGLAEGSQRLLSDQRPIEQPPRPAGLLGRLFGRT